MKSERGAENSIHLELKNERPKTRKWGEGTKNPPMTTHGIFLKKLRTGAFFISANEVC